MCENLTPLFRDQRWLQESNARSELCITEEPKQGCRLFYCRLRSHFLKLIMRSTSSNKSECDRRSSPGSPEDCANGNRLFIFSLFPGLGEPQTAWTEDERWEMKAWKLHGEGK